MSRLKAPIRYTRSLLPLVLLAGLAGCQSYTQESADMTSAWRAGDAAVAATVATREAEEAAGKKDELLWRLEQGTALAASGDIEASIEALDRAEEIVNQYEEAAKVKMTDQSVSLLTNQAMLPYRGHAYEKIMMNTLKAVNYMALGDAANARIELNRAFQRQEDAVIENQKRIEEAVEAAEQAKSGELENEKGEKTASYDVDRAKQDPNVSAATDAEMARIDERILPYADYVNPFSVFMDGLFFTHLGLDNADIERARKSFERVNSMSPSDYSAADYAMAERMANGQPADTVTYVLFATGTAPLRDEWRFDIPLFLVSSVSYIGASFPRLDYQDRYIPNLTVSTTEGASHTTALLSSIDSVVSKDFKNAWPGVFTKTLLATATKAIAGKAVEDSVGNDWRAQLLAKAANIGYQASTNRADLRSWTTLPKEYRYLRLPTPGDGQLQVQVGVFRETVPVTPGKTNLVLVRSVNDTAQPLMTQFTLN